jgi:hypothetical protein
MSLKVIQITIPIESYIPDIINSFSPEENYQMLKIGCETLNEGRKVVANLTSDEIFKKVRNDFDKEIDKLNLEIITERKTSLLLNEKLTKMYETQIEQLNKKFENAVSQIEIYKEGNSASLNEELNKVKHKYDLLLEEKDRQNQLNREVFDKATMLISKNLNKSSISIGDDGEQIFENLADTFKDFENYKIENKSKQGHKGDFHLFFKDFNILVDSKNYSGSVQKKEIIKIESDLSINDNMHFAWMVSLNSNICEYNKFTIMTKWITTDVGVKCILFINNLLSNKEPRDILRQAWMICNDFHRLTKKTVKEDGELEKYREKFLLHKKLIENLQERAAEIRRGVNVLQNSVKNLDNELLEILSLVSDDIVNEKFVSNNKIKEWWDENIEYVNDESKMTSTEIWSKFKKDNKEYVGENKITIELFKIAITSLVSSSNYVEKSKSIIEFNGFKWKQIEVKALENIEIENIVIEKKVKVKKVKKEKSIEFYFDEETDKKILEEYENEENDIMTISLINNIRPWEVVSLLVRYKIINSRGEARGYDKYKETEEYKSKIVNNKTHD